MTTEKVPQDVCDPRVGIPSTCPDCVSEYPEVLFVVKEEDDGEKIYTASEFYEDHACLYDDNEVAVYVLAEVSTVRSHISLDCFDKKETNE